MNFNARQTGAWSEQHKEQHQYGFPKQTKDRKGSITVHIHVALPLCTRRKSGHNLPSDASPHTSTLRIGTQYKRLQQQFGRAVPVSDGAAR